MNNTYLEEFRRQSLRQAQLKMLCILEEIDRICRLHGIQYWIEGGTLLGAMRHKGFIPWDDDLDVSMMRQDYNRFLEVAPTELPDTMFLQTRRSDPGIAFRACKVRDLNSYIADADDNNGQAYQKGIFVDVFPYDNAPSRGRRFMGKVARAVCIADTALHKPHCYSWRSAVALFYFGIKRPLCLWVWRLVRKITANGRYVAIDPYFSWCRAIHPKENVFPLTEVEFEGRKFPAPAKSDEYLATLYGDWRQIPPKEKRQIHSMIIVPELLQDPAKQ